MKLILSLTLTIVLFSYASPASAQSGRGFIDRLLERVEIQERRPAPASTTNATTSLPEPSSPVSTSTPPQEDRSTPNNQPEDVEKEESSPTSTIPTIPENPHGSGGASADPEVLAAQKSEPTAGAENVYRGNALSTDTTYILLTIAVVCGVMGLILSAPSRTVGFLPQPLTSA